MYHNKPILICHPTTPIMLPDPTSEWECYNVFNPSAVYHDGLFHMHYRAQGLDWVSRIGYAVSEDGVHWNRLRRPVLEPVDGADSRGIKDPRVTEIDGAFYMTTPLTDASSKTSEVFRNLGGLKLIWAAASCRWSPAATT